VLKLEISYRGLVIIALALLALWVAREVWPVILLFLVALIFMAALLPYVNWLVRRRVPRILAVLLVLVGILAVIAGCIAVVAPAVVDQFEHIRDDLPEDGRRVEDFAEDLGFDTEDWDLPERAEDIEWGRFASGEAALDVGQRVAFGLFSALTIIVLTAYLLASTPRLERFIYRFVPDERHEDVDNILQSLGRVVGGYVRGQSILSASIFTYTLTVLLVVDVPNPAAFALIAAFADVVPLIGALIATIPPTYAAFQESPTQAFIVLGALLFYQQVEDRILVPRIFGQTLNLPPLVVLMAVLVGAELLGITGVLLALPSAAAGRVLFDYVMEKRGGPPAPPPPEQEPLAPDPDSTTLPPAPSEA
jgi:predicted PurR-regulated permease PerM